LSVLRRARRHGAELEFCLTTLPSGFEVLNALRVVDCLDERRSEFMKSTDKDQRGDLVGAYRTVTRLRVDPAMVPKDVHAFRIEGWRVALIVSEVVVLAMAGSVGAKFEAVT
jgi:hypothetical protein